MSVTDISAARFAAASNASEVTARDTVAEALRRLDSKAWAAHSVIIIGLESDDDGSRIEVMHGGPASTNERLGVLARATDLSLRNMNGDA